MDGPVLGQGVQINQFPSPRVTGAPAPVTPAEQRRAAGRAARHAVVGVLCRGSWAVCLFTAFLGTCYFALSARRTGFAGTLTEGWTTVLAPVALVGWCLDLAFFRLRSRWESRGIYWLTTTAPTVAEVALRLMMVGIAVFILFGSGSTIWF